MGSKNVTICENCHNICKKCHNKFESVIFVKIISQSSERTENVSKLEKTSQIITTCHKTATKSHKTTMIFHKIATNCHKIVSTYCYNSSQNATQPVTKEMKCHKIVSKMPQIVTKIPLNVTIF